MQREEHGLGQNPNYVASIDVPVYKLGTSASAYGVLMRGFKQKHCANMPSTEPWSNHQALLENGLCSQQPDEEGEGANKTPNPALPVFPRIITELRAERTCEQDSAPPGKMRLR